MAKASAKVVFSVATRNKFWFGIMIRVSTYCSNSSTPASARRMRCAPSNWNGLVTTATVSIPASFAARAMAGAAPVPVPPPMPAAMKAMCEPLNEARTSSMASSAAARPTSGFEPAPRPCVRLAPNWMRASAWDCSKAWASVLATTNSTPSSSR